jgi:single-stranded DNA-binding protein
MSTLNKAMLIGYINSDIYENNNSHSFYLGTSESFKNKAGERQVRYESHKIFAGERFSNILSFAKKGQKIYIEGKINYYKPEDSQHSTTTIFANSIILLDKPNENSMQQESNNSQLNSNINDDLPF